MFGDRASSPPTYQDRLRSVSVHCARDALRTARSDCVPALRQVGVAFCLRPFVRVLRAVFDVARSGRKCAPPASPPFAPSLCTLQSVAPSSRLAYPNLPRPRHRHLNCCFLVRSPLSSHSQTSSAPVVARHLNCCSLVCSPLSSLLNPTVTARPTPASPNPSASASTLTSTSSSSCPSASRKVQPPCAT